MSRRPPLRIALACYGLYPYTVGGAERFYGALGAGLSTRASVTHLTRTLWSGSASVGSDGAARVGLTRWRRPRPPTSVMFGFALFRHLLLHGARYDVVHCCCFPLSSLLAARLGLLAHPASMLIGDWHEVLSPANLRRRFGRRGGRLRAIAQRGAIRAAPFAITFSQMHARRLEEQGARRVQVVPEFVPEAPLAAVTARSDRENLIVFAGRLVPEKRAHLVPAVLAVLAREDPSWRAIVFGAGPENERVRAIAVQHGVEQSLAMPGFAPWAEVSAALRRARALVFPATQEGFGLVVIEAASHGLPAVLVAGDDNASTELIEPGENGLVAASAEPADLADAVLQLAADERVHDRTLAWYERAQERFSVPAAVATLGALYERR